MVRRRRLEWSEGNTIFVVSLLQWRDIMCSRSSLLVEDSILPTNARSAV